MGSGIASVLTGHGARGAHPARRSKRGHAAPARPRAGMRAGPRRSSRRPDDPVSSCRPAEALRLAQRLAAPLRPARASRWWWTATRWTSAPCGRWARSFTAHGRRASSMAASSAARPSLATEGPTLYLSGDDAPRRRGRAGRLGLKARAIEGGIGAASALKMSYAGITKGLTALASLMVLGAIRAGAADALVAELRESQPQLAAALRQTACRTWSPKAYRWVAEMREIAAFLGATRRAPRFSRPPPSSTRGCPIRPVRKPKPCATSPIGSAPRPLPGRGPG